jgi:hypothetical protein
MTSGRRVPHARRVEKATNHREIRIAGLGTSTDTIRAAMLKGAIKGVLIACEAKTVMTEHGKSKPRVYDELSSSHEIVHQGRQDAIAAGITVVNIAKTFVSPLRQESGGGLHASEHKQPEAAGGMITHLRGLTDP